MTSTLAQVERKLSRIREQLGHLVRRGTLKLSPSDYFIQAECYDAERYDDVELWQQFGLTSRPPAGAEVLLLKAGGRGEGAIAVATQVRSERPTGLAAGDTCVYAAGGAVKARVDVLADGNIDLLPGAAGDTVDVGPSPTDYMLLGTTFDLALRTLITAMGVGWTAAGVGFTAIGTAMTALGSEAAISPAGQTACNTCATAMGTAATACTVAATACNPTFLAGVYLATWGRVK